MNEIARQIDAAIRYSRELDTETLNAFHRKAIEAGNQPLNHLVFADYLEEQGEPGAAELIRRAAEKSDSQQFSTRVDDPDSQSPLSVFFDRDPAKPSRQSLLLHHHDISHPGDSHGWRPYFYHYLRAEPEDLHRLLKGMTHVAGRDQAITDLLDANPHLRDEEEID